MLLILLLKNAESARLVSHSQVSGVVCIAGTLRSFGEPEVYQNLRRNVTCLNDALNV